MHIDEILDRLHQLPEQSKAGIKANITEVTCPKGKVLLEAGKVEKNVYFIKEGMVRAYAPMPDRQVTFWFGKEGDTVLSMKSYIAGQKGYEDVEALEDCTLYRLKAAHLRGLFETDIHLANLGRRLVEQELAKAEERLISMQFRTARQRYEELLRHSPDLLRRVSLAHLASYLGINQASLSRIRGNLR